MGKSKISWTDETWNPVVGCSHVSPGCDNCYAERMAWRLSGMAVKHHSDLVSCGKTGESGLDKYVCITECGHWNGTTATDESALEKPLHWRNPRKIFVCSMGDLFHESVPFEFIDKVMAVIALCPQHTFQVLTKRAERMKAYFEPIGGTTRHNWVFSAVGRQLNASKVKSFDWPLPNLWLGVTAENQEQADKRIPLLLQTPAAKRFVSCEPMLGAMDLGMYLGDPTGMACCGGEPEYCQGCNKHHEMQKYMKVSDDGLAAWYEQLDLVICGGESGPNARPMHPDWARSLRDQCQAAGVAFHFKQWGEYMPVVSNFLGKAKRVYRWPDESVSVFVGKKKAGHLLDGVEHRPEF